MHFEEIIFYSDLKYIPFITFCKKLSLYNLSLKIIDSILMGNNTVWSKSRFTVVHMENNTIKNIIQEQTVLCT